MERKGICPKYLGKGLKERQGITARKMGAKCNASAVPSVPDRFLHSPASDSVYPWLEIRRASGLRCGSLVPLRCPVES